MRFDGAIAQNEDIIDRIVNDVQASYRRTACTVEGGEVRKERRRIVDIESDYNGHVRVTYEDVPDVPQPRKHGTVFTHDFPACIHGYGPGGSPCPFCAHTPITDRKGEGA